MDAGVSCVLTCNASVEAAGVYASIVIVVQIIAKLLKFALKEKHTSIKKLATVYFSTMLVALALLPLCGLNLFQALIHANVLAYAQVFGHQVYKGFKERKGETTK